ncbi:4717_t:CDS:2, partial [Funneliformis geosporum]
TILQNMFIAFMGGVYSNAYEKGRVALLRFRAELISDYEALDEIYFYPPSPEAKYIHYLGKSKNYEDWNANVENREEKNLYDDYEKKTIERKLSFNQVDDYNFSSNNEDGYNISSEDSSSSESEIDEEDICIKVNELNNNVIEIDGKINDINTKLNRKVDDVCNTINEVNSKIDKLLNSIIK